jgi:LysR family transcriptional regulator, glycine cleavage system transcriptional activator
MIPALPPLNALRAFHAVGATGSMREAARALGVTPSAISHQIRILEASLGVALFERAPRQVSLTPPGHMLFAELAGAFRQIERGLARLQDGTAQRHLKVSALPLFTQAWLIPRLGRFQALHPQVQIAIETTNRLVDFEAENVDIAIRNLRAPSPGLINRKLLDVRAVPLCTAALKTALALSAPADLTRATLIHVSARPDGWATWLDSLGLAGLEAQGHIAFDTIPAALEAAASGRGVMLGLAPLVFDAPITARLIVPFRSRPFSGGSYYIAMRRADHARPVTRAFADWLVAEMAQDSRRLGQIALQVEPPE